VTGPVRPGQGFERLLQKSIFDKLDLFLSRLYQPVTNPTPQFLSLVLTPCPITT
jgi:hypothetical protein